MAVSTLALVHDDTLGMKWGSDHPTDGRRHRLAVALAEQAGLLDAPGLMRPDVPGPLSDDELARVFAPAFIAAIRRYSATPILAAEPEAQQWGIGGDNNAYSGMHEDSARACAAVTRGADLVGTGTARRAMIPAGGAHHGLSNRAWGFAIYNECALGAARLRDHGAERVAYVDLDVHHGNGVQWIFWDDPTVLTLSVHESGRHLFPGSGFAEEVGGPGAEGSSVNLALPPGAGDASYRRAMDEVVVPVLEAWKPDVLITQCGVDHHHGDPLSHLQTTMPLYPELWRGLREAADTLCAGRWVALGGGGYDPCNAPPRAWAALIAEMAEDTIPDDVPESWRQTMVGAECPEPPVGWLDDADPGAEGSAAANGTARAIRETLQAVSGHLGMGSD